VLPPAFRLVAVERGVDAFERARDRAPQGLDDGTVYWTDRADQLRLAVVLEPEAPRGTTLQAVHVLTVAAGDALGALLPPQMPLAFAWPGGLLLDGAQLGRVRAAVAPVVDPRAVPPWLVLGLRIDIGPYPGEPGEVPDRTTLADAGAPEITSGALAEAVSRHFLAWTRRWQEEGFAPVRASWNARRQEGAALDDEGRCRVGAAVFPLEAVLAELA
jgi:BirA family transcriptional regulator, biotin operon repressor / biotin---[acetyl-CoA-carboxylase] ligase